MGLLDKIIKRSSWTPDDDRWYGDLSTPSSTGVTVDNDSAKSLTAVYAAIRILSQSISSLPLHLYKRTKDGKERVTEGPLVELIEKPCKEMTGMVYREVMVDHIAGWGTHFAEIERDSIKRVIGLWPLNPSKMRVERIGNRDVQYKYTLTDGTTKIFNSAQIMSVAGYGSNGLTGHNPIKLFQEAIGLGLAAEEYGARFFGNSARPSGVLRTDLQLSAEAKKNLGESWRAAYGGLSNSHRVAILDEGLTFQAISIDPAAAQLLETRKYTITDIARIFNVPPHMLADLDRATFSNIEQQSLEFIKFTLLPWLVRIEEVLNLTLLNDAERKVYYVKHQVAGLERADIVARYTAHNIARMGGWMTANEIRLIENMNPIDGGDEVLVPLNMITLSQAIEAPVPYKPPEKKEEKALTPSIEERSVKHTNRLRRQYEPLFERSAAKIIAKEEKAINKAIDKWMRERDAFDFAAWMDDFYNELPEHIKREFKPLLMSYAEAVQASAASEVGSEVGMNDALRAFIATYLDAYSERHVNDSMRQLESIVKQSPVTESPDTLKGNITEWAGRKPKQIAEYETVRGASAISKIVYAAAGITLLKWVTQGSESCPLCNKLNGKVVGIDKPFAEGKASGIDVGKPKFHPPLHKGCVCSIVPVKK